MFKDIEELRKSFNIDSNSLPNLESLNNLKIKYLGKKGLLTNLFDNIKNIPLSERKIYGQELNKIKEEIESFIQNKERYFQKIINEEKLKNEWIDITFPYEVKKFNGHLTPISKVIYEIVEIFKNLGFSIFDGPQIEDDYHNFTALNIPETHPARDMQDTIWLKNGLLLRTHTSAVQIRAMENFEPPLKGIAPGRVFRYEAIDASHENTFYQVEGIMIDKDISVANLIYFMKTLLSEIFKKEVHIRLRPGFFPFVEPGFELDIKCLICGGKGCSVCKNVGWVELLPCGLIHPNVLIEGGINPEKWSGFAFGLGLNRLAMMKYGINDIRWFQSGDLRFYYQF
ncbi:MAG: phenylalanine--tRNA ligase subunit alpha [Spirochaetes bacterium]|nr:phenylalanine--tRNA ligase subunit alpha [Spirochaetota bacterium]